MAFEPLANPWLDFRVLAFDDDVLVVDKPAGIVVHGGDEKRADDVTHRLAAWLERRGAGTYLGVHQRLDKDASGVLFFTRRREQNPGVARDMETHRAEKTYRAVVAGKLAPRGTLEHRLEHVRGEKTHVVKRGGQLARAHYRVLARGPGRLLLELRAETGRTHQLRAQLALAGAPIVGDEIYGGEAGARLMLHASALRLPSIGRRFESPEPACFARALANAAPSLGSSGELENALRDAAVLRWSLTRSNDAFRLVNGARDLLPGVAVDRYGDFAVLVLSSDEAKARANELAKSVLELGARGVHLKIRERTELRRADPTALAPPQPIAGEGAPAEFVVHEGELRFGVRLGEGFSTGLFLDQRDNRALVASLARGRRVLNLFAYTCSFSAAAAKGGASEVVSVDLSAPALARGRDNFAQNGIDAERHRFVHADCIDWLRAAKKRAERFDLVILDPPSFGTRGKRATFDVASGYTGVARAVFEISAPGARVLAVTNHKKTSRAGLRRMLHEAARQSGRRLAQMKDLASPQDFPDAPEGPEGMKSVLCTLGS